MEGFLNLIRPFLGWDNSLTYSLYRWGFLHFRYLKWLVINWFLAAWKFRIAARWMNGWFSESHAYWWWANERFRIWNVSSIFGAWNAKCPIFKAIVAGFRGKVAYKNSTLGVPGGLNLKSLFKRAWCLGLGFVRGDVFYFFDTMGFITMK